MAKHINTCPHCKTMYASAFPGDAPCSAACAAALRTSPGRRATDDQPQTSGGGSGGRSGGGGSSPKGKGGLCSIVTGALIAAPATLVYLAVRLARR